MISSYEFTAESRGKTLKINQYLVVSKLEFI